MATKKRKRRRRIWGRVLLILLFISAAVGIVYAATVKPPEMTQPDERSSQEDPSQTVSTDPVPTDPRKENCFNILLCGADDGNGNGDTIIFMRFDAGNQTADCVSIPRDTKVVLDGKARKINSTYGSGGMDLMAQAVSELLGVPVDFAVAVNLKGFVELVDAIGGVDFEIPINMNYDDPLQNLSIHFTKGMHHLSGAQALKVVRFRHNNDKTGYGGSEDIGRMGTQQAFLKTVAQQILQPSNLDKIPTFAKIFQKYVKTDLSLGNLVWLGQEALSMGVGNINFYTLPGEWKSPYIHLMPGETLSMVNQCLNPYVADRTLDQLNIPG